MKKNILRKAIIFGLVILSLGINFLPITSGKGNNLENSELKYYDKEETDLLKNYQMSKSDFTIPPWGGAMIHSDRHLSDYIDLPVPTNDVEILWINYELAGEKKGTLGTGQSSNGKIAACTWGSPLPKPFDSDNLVVYDYNGNRIWQSNDLFNLFAQVNTPLVSMENKIIACDDQYLRMIDPYNNDDGEFLWEESIDMLVESPLSPTLTENSVILLPSIGLSGSLYAFDLDNNGNFLDFWSDVDNYIAMNSICVNGNRVYILVHKFKLPPANSSSRLYAIDITKTSGHVFSEAWCFEYDGLSQASPTYIDGTIYFDRYKETAPDDDPYLYAIIDNGDSYSKKWTNDTDTIITCGSKTNFSLTYDPRGGIWYQEHDAGKLCRYCLNNGTQLDEIIVDELIDEYDLLGQRLHFKTMSPMVICSGGLHPVMLVSANTPLWTYPIKRYVIAIRLEQNDNQLLWKVLVDDDEWLNYIGSLYTVLMDESWQNPRIICAKYKGGVMAIGSNSPPGAPKIDGVIQCKLNVNYPYTVQSSDSENDDVYYFIDWGDGSISSWKGPYESGKKIEFNHKWFKYGVFQIKVKAKDVFGAESGWATFEVTVPRNKALLISQSFFLWSFERFPILKHLIGY